MTLIEQFAAFLRQERPTKEVSVLKNDFSYTDGWQQSTDTIEIIDFNQLCNAMDEFGRKLRGES